MMHHLARAACSYTSPVPRVPLAVLAVYAFANVSGGHLNPAVSFALMCTGHMKWWKSIMYMCAQVGIPSDTPAYTAALSHQPSNASLPLLARQTMYEHYCLQIRGAIFVALIYTSLIPALYIGSWPGSPGCFAPGNGTSLGGVFGWETMMTFLLVMTVYAAAVAKPGHGNAAPLAIGLSLYAAAISGMHTESHTHTHTHTIHTGKQTDICMVVRLCGFASLQRFCCTTCTDSGTTQVGSIATSGSAVWRLCSQVASTQVPV